MGGRPGKRRQRSPEHSAVRYCTRRALRGSGSLLPMLFTYCCQTWPHEGCCCRGCSQRQLPTPAGPGSLAPSRGGPQTQIWVSSVLMFLREGEGNYSLVCLKGLQYTEPNFHLMWLKIIKLYYRVVFGRYFPAVGGAKWLTSAPLRAATSASHGDQPKNSPGVVTQTQQEVGHFESSAHSFAINKWCTCTKSSYSFNRLDFKFCQSGSNTSHHVERFNV